jgi:hypothetical protein
MAEASEQSTHRAREDFLTEDERRIYGFSAL